MSTIDEYLNTNTTPTQKIELQRIRDIVSLTAPDAIEVISYGMPTFKYKKRSLIHFAAFKNHMSIFPTAAPIDELKDKLADFRTAKGTIQFTEKKPVPEELIKELLLLRMTQIDNK